MVRWDYIGRTEFTKCFGLQEQIREALLDGSGPETVILTEHERVFTFGRREQGENLLFSEKLLKKKGFSIVKTTRGGLVTYHGPGQLLIYPIINLRKHSLKVKEYVEKLENSVIDLVGKYGIKAERKDGFPGVWLGNKKIGSLGIHIKKMVTMHGFALNSFTNLDDFNYINPCGFKDITITSIEKEVSQKPPLDKLAEEFMISFEKIFGIQTERVSIEKDLVK